METTHNKIITEIVSEFLNKLGFIGSVVIEEMSSDEKNTILCKITVNKDQNFLIGQHGVNLSALQHLIRIILHKKIENVPNILVDVNDYFSEKKLLLEKEAEKAMKEVLDNKLSLTLRPMFPYERKIIHDFLSKYATICTKSIGSGDDRRVMVSLSLSKDDDSIDS